jgi:hypothetical protein
MNSLSERSLGSVEHLTLLEVAVRKLSVEVLYLLGGEWLEDVHHGEESYPFLLVVMLPVCQLPQPPTSFGLCDDSQAVF